MNVSVSSIYHAAVIYTAAEWDEVEESLCAKVQAGNLCGYLDAVAGAADRLPSNSYAFRRCAELYDRIDQVAQRKAALGVF